MRVNQTFFVQYAKFLKKVSEDGNFIYVEAIKPIKKKEVKKQESKHPIQELRKYGSKNPFFGVDYIVGTLEHFTLAHAKGGTLEGETFEVVGKYQDFKNFKEKETKLLNDFYSERIHKGESFSLYGVCEGGVLAGF